MGVKVIGEIKHDNCKDCVSKCEHAGKDREFVCKDGISCKVKKPKVTNGDKIRSMTDDELDMFFREIKNRARIIALGKKPELLEELVNLDWLKQPAEEE